MADFDSMSPEEFRAYLRADREGAASITVPPPGEDAIAKASQNYAASQIKSSRGVSDEQDYATRLGARPGVPFDANTGLPFKVRTKLESLRDPKEQESYLKKVYGEGNVRRNPSGGLVLTTHDNGNPKDILANPLGIDLSDLGAVAAQAPELVGTVVGAVLSRGGSLAPGIWRATKTLAATVAGSEIAGLAKDRAVSDRPSSELATERLESAATGMILGAGAGFLTKVATKAVSPFSQVSDLQFDARRAQQFFKENFGMELPLTPAEATGSAFLQRSEALMLQKPGFSAPLRKMLRERNKKIAEIQKMVMGGAVPDEELASQQAIDSLREKISPFRKDVESAARALIKTGEKELEDVMAASTGVGGTVNKTLLGRSIRDAAFEQREAFRTQGAHVPLYESLFNDPRIQAKSIPAAPLAADAKALLDKLPSTSQGLMEEFAPAAVKSKLRALSETGKDSFRLDELMRMRREVANDIAQGEAVPGMKTKDLSSIQEMLTNRIKTGLDAIDPALAKTWEAANSEYAKGVVRFKKSGIAELFRDPEQASFLGDTEIVARATSGRKAQDVYTAYKEFFGKDSAQMRQFRRAIADDVMSQTPLSDVVDAGGFVRRIDELAKDAPGVLSEVFGLDAKKARDIATAIKGAEGNLSTRELANAMRSGTLTGEKLVELMRAQERQSLAYRNSIVKSIEDGSFSAEKIKPTEFVDKMAFTAEPSELRGVIALMNDLPQELEDIRRLTFKKILDRSTVFTSQGDQIIDAKRLEKIITDENSVKRLTTILGKDTFEVLKQYRNLLKPGSLRDEAFSAAGGLSAGQQIAGTIERGELRYLARAAQNFALSTIYTSPALRGYFANTLLGPVGSANIVNYAIASVPFARALLETYGKEMGKQVAFEAKASLDRFVQENPASAAQPEVPQTRVHDDMSPEEFRRALRE